MDNPVRHPPRENGRDVSCITRQREVEMRKILLMVLLAVASNSAIAEWVKVGSNELDSLYADPTTIIKSAYKVKMQTLYDYKSAMKSAGVTFLSTVAQEEYDCKGNRSRTLYFSFHSRNLGKGKKVYSDTDPHEWEPVKPGSARETFWKSACGKR